MQTGVNYRLRTGAEYKESLRDGRKVWVLGVGPVDDVTTHPATAAMVDAHALWYDRHTDPAWQDTLLTQPDAAGVRRPLAFEIPRTAGDLTRLGEAIRSVAFTNAGNITHTPGYGALVALGMLNAVSVYGPPERAAVARNYRDMLAREGRFITLTAPPPPGDKFLAPEEKMLPRIVKETDGGIIVRGMVGLATGLPYADEAFVPAGGRPGALPDQAVWFAVPLNSPGVRMFTRPPSARLENRYMFPLSTRYDELDSQTEFDDVFVPWERVFAFRNVEFTSLTEGRDLSLGWLIWHHLVTYLARAQYTLGLALAIADTLDLRGNRAVLDSLTDLVVAAETIRTCLKAAELDGTITPIGSATPNGIHMASGTIYTLQNRQRMAEIVRILAGQGGVLAPSLEDLADDSAGPSLERAFGGGRYSAAQRVALLHLAHDHVGSGLDARESAFETHASLGMSGWRHRVQRWFDRYSELANGVVATLDGIEMPRGQELPKLELDDLRRVAFYG